MSKKNAKKTSEQLTLKLRSLTGRGRTIVFICTIAVVLVALVLVNVIARTLTTRYSLYADLTANAAFRLQDATKEFAENLDKDVDLYVLANENVFEGYGDYYVQANKLVHQLDAASDKVRIHYVDLTTNPSFTASYPDVDWSESHLMLAVCGERYQILDAEDFFDYELDESTYTYVITSQHIEQALATAILGVSTDQIINISVLTGQDEEDLSPFLKLLTNNAYNVEEVNLSTATLPADSTFLIIYAPQVDIDDDMAEQIADWLYNDGNYGRNLVYFPSDKQPVDSFENLNALIADWGMKVDYGYVYESDASYIAASLNTPLCSMYEYADETFTEDLRNPSIPVFLYYTMPIEITDENIAKAMLTSSEKAGFAPMLEEDREGYEPVIQAYNGAAYGTKSNGETEDERASHVVVIGSYDALSEGFLKYNSYNNGAYFVNIFNVLCDRGNLGIVIEGKNLDSQHLGVQTDTTVFLFWFVVVAIPLSLLIAGLVMGIIRRFK